VAAGNKYTLAVTADGSLWGWGENHSGQLGDGAPVTIRATPVQANIAGVRAAAGGAEHTVIVKSDGSVWACGNNKYGQLGDDTGLLTRVKPVLRRVNPVQVKLADGSPLRGIAAVACGKRHTLALKADGTLVAWGGNSGTLGVGGGTVGSPVPWPMPVQLADGIPLSGITAIAAGEVHSVAIGGE
jgi:alpha-tubulin suppressor-like RCC1 family protein